MARLTYIQNQSFKNPTQITWLLWFLSPVISLILLKYFHFNEIKHILAKMYVYINICMYECRWMYFVTWLPKRQTSKHPFMPQILLSSLWCNGKPSERFHRIELNCIECLCLCLSWGIIPFIVFLISILREVHPSNSNEDCKAQFEGENVRVWIAQGGRGREGGRKDSKQERWGKEGR